MDESPNLENRYKLVMELNELLEEMINVNKQIKIMKSENINLLIQNNSIENDISKREHSLNQL